VSRAGETGALPDAEDGAAGVDEPGAHACVAARAAREQDARLVKGDDEPRACPSKGTGEIPEPVQGASTAESPREKPGRPCVAWAE
jgi:hypothetical protein